MVALIHPQTAPGRDALRLVAENGRLIEPIPAGHGDAGHDDAGRRPGGSTVGLSAMLGDQRLIVVAVAIALAVLMPLVMLRVAQGGPEASDWSGVRAATGQGGVSQSAAANPGQSAISAPDAGVVVVRPGESLWSIAERIAPGQDPRPVVAALREVNGGDVVAQGQQIVVPEDLLD